jgi:DhnA family fructose-bisphosphate aldolase class Ia
MHTGMKIRYDRIVNPESGKTVMIPFDHGIPFGPLPGIVDPRLTVRRAAEGCATAVIFNQGLADVLLPEYNSKIATIHMLTNSCTADDPLFGSVERAVKYAADAVAIEILIGHEAERQMIEQALPVLDACHEWNMPSVFMMYPEDSHAENIGEAEAILRAARAGAELGATIVKTAWAGNKSVMARVVEACPAPLVVAGGGKKSVEETFQLARDSVDIGAIGVAMGRNLWGAADPVKMIKAMCAVVHKNASADDAMGMIQ